MNLIPSQLWYFGGRESQAFPSILCIFSIKNINLGVCVCVCVCVCVSVCIPDHSVRSNSLQPYGLCGSCVYGLSQAGILEWVTMLSSRGSS